MFPTSSQWPPGGEEGFEGAVDWGRLAEARPGGRRFSGQIIDDGKAQTPVAAAIPHTAICYSWSKAQALAGERIGFLALSPRLPDAAQLFAAATFANRTLGFVNAPALWQLCLENLDMTSLRRSGRARV